MLSDQKGQSLMELVIVIAVMVIVIGALTFATIASLRNAQFAKNQAQATKYAQEGLEWARSGRDRNSLISIPPTSVVSWNGNGAVNTSIWELRITGSNTGSCDYEPVSPSLPTPCYLKFLSNGSLQNIAGFGTPFQKTNAEPIPHDAPIFYRALTLSDDSSFAIQKTVTAIVTWTDFSGPHESRLTTILRKI